MEMNDSRAVSSRASIPETISVREFAEAFNLDLKYQYEKIRKGQLPAIRVGKRYRIPMSYIQDLFKGAQPEGR